MEFSTIERKKEFDGLFKNKILPFFEDLGFSRHTKTSKRLYKKLKQELCVFVFLEYKSRFESYGITIAYFDDEIGTIYDDEYLAIAKLKTPSFNGENAAELDSAVDEWLIQLQTWTIPFIDKYTTHQAILDADEFEIPKSREKEIVELAKRKSENK